jgi:ketosteroid isomerase-like protein
MKLQICSLGSSSLSAATGAILIDGRVDPRGFLSCRLTSVFRAYEALGRGGGLMRDKNKNRTFGKLATLGLAFMLTASPALAGDKSDIDGRVKMWQAAFNGGDGNSVAALYTEDATRMPYQAPVIEGRAAISANIQATHDAGATKIDLKVLGSESQGSMSWAHGTYQLKNAEGSTVQKGKWMNVSKKVGKEWLIHRDIWNTDAPDL